MNTKELIKTALQYDSDDDEYWKCISQLWSLCNEQTYNLAKKLLASPRPREREIAADILGQIWTKLFYNATDNDLFDVLDKQKQLQSETADLIFPLLESEKEMDTLIAYINALDHLNFGCDNREKMKALLPFGSHSDARIRLAVACALGGSGDWPKWEVNALIRLSRDVDDDVRNWSTFGLAQLCKRNTQAIREALFDRLINDPYDEVRSEAAMGLSIRNDRRGIPSVLHELTEKELDHNRVGSGFIVAASYYKDIVFLPVLRHLHQTWIIDDEDRELIEEAIESCNQPN